MQYLTPDIQPRWNQILFDIFKKFIAICEQHDLRYYSAGGTLIGAIRHHGMIPWDDDIDVFMPRPDYDRFRQICQKEPLGIYELRCAENTDNYYMQFSKLCNKNTTILEYKNMPCVYGLYIDVFPLDGIGNDYETALKEKRHFEKVQNTLESISTRYLFVDYMKLLGDSHEWGRFVHKMIGFFFRPLYRRHLMKKLNRIMRKYNFEDSRYVVTYSGVYRQKEIYPKEWLGQAREVAFEDFKIRVPENYDAYLRHFFGNYMQLPPEDQRQYKHEKVFFDLDRGLNYQDIKAILKTRSK